MLNVRNNEKKNLKDPRIKGKYYRLNQKTKDIQILQKTDLISYLGLYG